MLEKSALEVRLQIRRTRSPSNWTLIFAAVLLVGWVEDVAAGRRPRLLPWNRVGRTRNAADPSVPGLADIAWREIERQREQAGIPKLVVDGALAITSPTGKSYRERIDAAKTELELSDVLDDFIAMVPLGKRFFAQRNPVRTGGPMQVSVSFAEAHAARKPYPYPVARDIRSGQQPIRRRDSCRPGPRTYPTPDRRVMAPDPG